MLRQFKPWSMTTWSPTSRSRTSSPFSATYPLISWPENLWRSRKWNRSSVLIRVVVRVSGKNVCISATDTHCRHAHQHITRGNLRLGALHGLRAGRHQSARMPSSSRLRVQDVRKLLSQRSLRLPRHRPCCLSSTSISLVSSLTASRNSANRFIVSCTPTSSGVAGRSPIACLIAASLSSGATGIGSPPNSNQLALSFLVNDLSNLSHFNSLAVKVEYVSTW